MYSTPHHTYAAPSCFKVIYTHHHPLPNAPLPGPVLPPQTCGIAHAGTEPLVLTSAAAGRSAHPEGAGAGAGVGELGFGARADASEYRSGCHDDSITVFTARQSGCLSFVLPPSPPHPTPACLLSPSPSNVNAGPWGGGGGRRSTRGGVFVCFVC